MPWLSSLAKLRTPTWPPGGVNFSALSTRLPMASNRRLGSPCITTAAIACLRQRDALLLCHRLVKFYDVGGYLRQVQVGETGAACATFHLGDTQHGGESLQETADFLDGLVHRGGVILRRSATPARTLQPGEQARQRRSKVMGNVVTDALHLQHQALDLRQHEVDLLRQPVEVAGIPARGQPAGQVAADDALNGLGDAFDAANRIRAGDGCPGQAEQDGGQAAP